MRILHILADGPTDLSTRVIGAERPDHEVEVIDLRRGEISHEALVREIFYHDRVICW